ncbi:MAG: NADH-quinone oxidoreductase subunit A [Deltaproteobacteria bacterium]|nr:NADH-quinone oxidoreductase subunit A [Deltaproteobacteria bacterium]
MINYLAILLMIGFVSFMGVFVLFLNQLLSPRNPYGEKLSPWECGMEPVGEADTGRFKVHYFIVAILFIVFDVETLFLFPWAVILPDSGLSMLLFVEMFVFIAVLAVGFVYAWARGALDWV